MKNPGYQQEIQYFHIYVYCNKKNHVLRILLTFNVL